MKKHIVNIAVISLFATGIITVPTLSRAQNADTNMPAASEQTPVKTKKHGGLVFRGTVSAVDTNAMTFTAGHRTFNVTSETKISKDGAPVTLSDIAVGDKIGGAYKKSDDGKLDATTVNDGKKKTSDMQQ